MMASTRCGPGALVELGVLVALPPVTIAAPRLCSGGACSIYMSFSAPPLICALCRFCEFPLGALAARVPPFLFFFGAGAFLLADGIVGVLAAAMPDGVSMLMLSVISSMATPAACRCCPRPP